jgi:hypothetical protein
MHLCSSNGGHVNHPILRIVGILAATASCTPDIIATETVSITASPPALTIYPGQQTSVAITAASENYTGPVGVEITDLPSGITASPLTVDVGATGTVILTASSTAGQEGFASGSTSWDTIANVVAATDASTMITPIELTISLSDPASAPPL